MEEIVRNALVNWDASNPYLGSILPTVIDPTKNALMTSIPDWVNTKNTLVTVPYDYIWATYPTTSSEVYTFKTWWSGWTTVATITVTYSDSTKEVLSSVAKT